MLDRVNRDSIELVVELRRELETAEMPMVISGCIGPRGDGYDPAQVMSEDDAERYHRTQITTYRETDADLVSALHPAPTSPKPSASCAPRRAVRCRSPSRSRSRPTAGFPGDHLGAAIDRVDEATNAAAAPLHDQLRPPRPTSRPCWRTAASGSSASAASAPTARAAATPSSTSPTSSMTGIRSSSVCSTLDLRARFPHLTVLGGCCGTDERHIRQIAHACGTVG